MSSLIKRSNPFPVSVASRITGTGKLAWTPVFSATPFLLGLTGPYLATSIFHVNVNEFPIFGGFDFLVLPALSILSGLVLQDWESHKAKELTKALFSSDDKKILAKAKKNISLRLRLTMLGYRPIAPTVLFTETDKLNMVHTQATLVWNGGSYFIKIETVDALKTWDLALESVVPENIRESIALTAIARDAKYLANKIREETKMRKALRYENADDLRHWRQRGASVSVEEDMDLDADYECSCCAL